MPESSGPPFASRPQNGMQFQAPRRFMNGTLGFGGHPPLDVCQMRRFCEKSLLFMWQNSPHLVKRIPLPGFIEVLPGSPSCEKISFFFSASQPGDSAFCPKCGRMMQKLQALSNLHSTRQSSIADTNTMVWATNTFATFGRIAPRHQNDRRRSSRRLHCIRNGIVDWAF